MTPRIIKTRTTNSETKVRIPQMIVTLLLRTAASSLPKPLVTRLPTLILPKQRRPEPQSYRGLTCVALAGVGATGGGWAKAVSATPDEARTDPAVSKAIRMRTKLSMAEAAVPGADEVRAQSLFRWSTSGRTHPEAP